MWSLANSSYIVIDTYTATLATEQYSPDISVKVRVCVVAPTPAEDLRLGLSSAPSSVASKCKVTFTVFFTSDLPAAQIIG